MQLDRIKRFLQGYQAYLNSRRAEDRLYYWESQRYWQQHFDLTAPDLASVYDRSLDNKQTRRLWSRQAYAPKEMMVYFIGMEPAFTQSMFSELFDEEKNIEIRIDRFVFYCDQLLEQYLERHPRAAHQRHYHDDGYTMISLYLSFQFPDRYAPYDEDTFLKLLRKVGAANVPPVGDFARHVKVMRTLMRFIEKEDALMVAHRRRLRPNRDFEGNSLLLAFDFARYVVEEGGV